MKRNGFCQKQCIGMLHLDENFYEKHSIHTDGYVSCNSLPCKYIFLEAYHQSWIVGNVSHVWVSLDSYSLVYLEEMSLYQ